MIALIFLSLKALLFLQVDQQLEAARNLAPLRKVHLYCC